MMWRIEERLRFKKILWKEYNNSRCIRFFVLPVDGKLDERKLDAAEEKLDAGEKLKGQLKKAQMVQPNLKVKDRIDTTRRDTSRL